MIFLVGSALSGMAQDMSQLIAFRAVQGLGAGGLMVGVMAIIGDLIPPRERGKYQGMMAGVMALAMIGGPLVGGTITDNLGLALDLLHQPAARRGRAGLVTAVLHLPKKRAEGEDRLPRRRAAHRRHHRDRAGHHLGRYGVRLGLRRIMELIALGVASLVGFVFWQTKAAEPIVPLHIFRNRNFTLMSLIGFIAGFVMFGAMLFLPLYQQSVQGASATNSGLLLLPMLLRDDGRLAGRRPGHHQHRQVQDLPDRGQRRSWSSVCSCCPPWTPAPPG